MSRHLPRPRIALAVIAVATILPGTVACSSPGSSPDSSEGASTDAASSATATPPLGRRPTIVLVHGAWADASSWNGVTEQLLAEGYEVRAIANPVEDLTTDAETVADFLRSLTGPVVLVGHSYGGAVITNAAAGIANVKALVYVDASAPDVGETNASLSGADSILTVAPAEDLFTKVPAPNAPSGATDLYLNEDVFIENFAGDLPEEVSTRLWASQRAASTAAFGTPSKYAAWKTIPSWYFISSGDQIITPASEQRMARRAKSDVTVFQGGSHLTLISHPEAVTEVIKKAIRSLD